MIPTLAAAAVMLTVFLLIVAIRTWQSDLRWSLYPLTPLLLCFALATGYVINTRLGYATDNLGDLHEEFAFVAATGDDPIYLLAVPAGGAEPRLYRIPKSMLDDEERRALGQAQAKSEKGVPQSGTFSEGELEMYDFDVARIAPKSG